MKKMNMLKKIEIYYLSFQIVPLFLSVSVQKKRKQKIKNFNIMNQTMFRKF